MGKRPTFGKREREREKEAKAKAKRERRLQGEPNGGGAPADADESPEVPSEVVLAQLAEAHRQFQDAEISFEEYDETKSALLRQLRVD